jgi:hypothetical protein
VEPDQVVRRPLVTVEDFVAREYRPNKHPARFEVDIYEEPKA